MTESIYILIRLLVRAMANRMALEEEEADFVYVKPISLERKVAYHQHTKLTQIAAPQGDYLKAV